MVPFIELVIVIVIAIMGDVERRRPLYQAGLLRGWERSDARIGHQVPQQGGDSPLEHLGLDWIFWISRPVAGLVPLLR